MSFQAGSKLSRTPETTHCREYTVDFWSCGELERLKISRVWFSGGSLGR